MSGVETHMNFNGMSAGESEVAHYLSFTDGGRPAEEVLEAVHDILKDVHDKEHARGIIDAAIAHDVGGTAILAIVDHLPTETEVLQLRANRIRFAEHSQPGEQAAA
jgi:hypothetical protein